MATAVAVSSTVAASGIHSISAKVNNSSANMLAELKAKQAEREAENGTAKSITVSESPVKIATTLKQVGQRRDYQMIDPRTIDIEPGFNARDYTLPENRAHLDRLKLLIIEAGRVNDPIIVRLNRETGRAIVIDGECRLRAVLELIAENVYPFTEADMPCYPAPPGSDDEATRRFASLYANEGKSFSKWELGRGYQALFDLNISLTTIAKKTANSESFIRECIDLSNAPDELKQLLSSQAVSPAEAIRVVRSADIPAAVSTLQAAVQEKKAKGLKGPVKRAKAPSQAKSVPAKAPVNPDLLKAITDALADLIDDVAVVDLNNEKQERVSVDRTLLLKVASLLTVDMSDETVESITAGAAQN
jgi:ParB-like chromosome segregation protein Spo0J